jgi:uncharacterized protein YhaN
VYELQKQVRQTSDIADPVEQQIELNRVWEELAKLQLVLNASSIDSVQTPDQTVTERSFIEEWLANCEKEITQKIAEVININKTNWSIPTYPVVCGNHECKHETNLVIELDQSNFFA